MNLKSIITKITFVFLIAIMLLVAVFFAYLDYEKKQFVLLLKKEYTKITNHIHQNRLPPHKIKQFVKQFNLVPEKNLQNLKNNNELMTQGRGFEVLKYKNNLYLHFETPHFRIMFKNLNKYKQSYMKFVVFGLVFVLFIFIYYLIIKNIKQTKLLLDSRQLFLRTVMHELKTPIAKGRIVSELIGDEKQKNRMITIFEKLNQQLDNFAKIEQIVSKNYTPNIHSFDIEIIIQNSIDSLILDNTNNIILQNITPKKLNVDLNLFSMAVKNLIDNALKYSSDNKVIIQEDKNKLLFISKGNKLSKPLEEYFKPFHNDTKNKNHGMGLGLYIVYSILNLHQFGFEYKYNNGNNIFEIVY